MKPSSENVIEFIMARKTCPLLASIRKSILPLNNALPSSVASISITEYLKSPVSKKRFVHYNTSALVEALILVMKNNRMRFGDLLVKQLMGIAMGMSPAPTIANLFVAIHEAAAILRFVGVFLLWLKRFIDDGFGIWLHDPDPTVDDAN